MKNIKSLAMVILMLVLATSLPLAACNNSNPTQSTTTTQDTQTTTPTTTTSSVKNPGAVIEASLNSAETLDIHFMAAAATTAIAYNVYDSLLSSDLDGNLAPSLSTEVPTAANGLISSSDNGQTNISFPIRTGVVFHNGETLTPEDVKYTFLRGIISGRMATVAQALLNDTDYSNLTSKQDLESVFTPLNDSISINGNNVVFHLIQPFSPFLEIIADDGAVFGIMDKSWAIEQGAWPETAATMEQYMSLTDATNTLHDKMMGTGPFKLASWQPGERIVLEKHEDYWKGSAEIDRVIRQVVADNNTAIQMLGQGDVDIIQINKSEVAQVKGVDGIEVVEDIPIAQLIKINFNFDIQGDRFIGNGEMGNSGTPDNLFSDINVRKGFSYAFDYEVFINEVLLGAGITPYGPVLVGFPTANPDNPQYYLSLEKAEEHLRLAFDGQLWEKGFKLTVPYNEGSEPRQRALEILQTNLRTINPKFELELTSLPWAAYVAAINDKEMPLSIFGILPTYRHPYAALHYHMHSTGYYAPVEGYVQLAQEKYDSLIEELGSTFDEERMEEISYLLQKYSYDDALSIFHHQAIGQLAMRDWLNGYEITRAPFLINYYKISKG